MARLFVSSGRAYSRGGNRCSEGTRSDSVDILVASGAGCSQCHQNFWPSDSWVAREVYSKRCDARDERAVLRRMRPTPQRPRRQTEALAVRQSERLYVLNGFVARGHPYRLGSIAPIPVRLGTNSSTSGSTNEEPGYRAQPLGRGARSTAIALASTSCGSLAKPFRVR